LRWAVAALLALLSTISLLLAIPGVAKQLRTEVPVIRCVFPQPMESEGSFNVVVARFTVLDENGKRIGGKDGKALAEYMFRNLAFNFEDLELDTAYEIRPPDHTCRLAGSTRPEREAAAAKLAGRINADIIVYGVITDTGKQSRFSPEFYVSHTGFAEGDEITGQHEMGRELRLALPFDAVDFSPADNPALSARTEALSLLTMGLAHYALDDFEQALVYFEKAEGTEGWFQDAGKEVVHLLMGNAYVRWDSQRHCIDDVDGHLEEAWSQHHAALAINPAYARAQVGLADVLRQMALEGVFDDSFAGTDLDRLDEATDAYETALHLGNPPGSANIETKVHFGMGQVYVARYLYAVATGGAWSAPMSRARAEFEQVVGEYESGNGRVKNLAGHAHARLGLLARLKKDSGTAVEHYTRAIELVTPYYQAYYYTRLAQVYADEDQIELAVQACDEAIAIAEFYGDEACHRKFSAMRDELRGTGP
jgi:tetratricopeptide (TPR) repeat protein